MATVRSYKELTVWQKSMDLVVTIYRITTKFPREEMFGLTSQIRRAAVSIPSNIAEGQSRNSSNEFRHFLGICQGSLAELETQLELSNRLGYASDDHTEVIAAECKQIGMMLHGLVRSLPSTK